MDLGVISLSDIQTNPATGRPHSYQQRINEILGYATLADRSGLDVFALGEHHTLDFAVSSPPVVLAAAATRTSRIRLTSGVTVLSVLDPVRVYQDYATLDLVSHGRAEIIAGRSAFTEPFDIFGVDLADYDAAFSEKLDLLLQLRDNDLLTWSGRFRPPLHHAPITPRAAQQPLPVWLGVGGSPGSAVRAGRLGLPMMLGYIGGPLDHPRRTVELHRHAGDLAGHPEKLQVGISTHFYAAATPEAARQNFPYYHEYLRPKDPRWTRVRGQPGPVRGRHPTRQRHHGRLQRTAHRQDPRRPPGPRPRPVPRPDRLGRSAPGRRRGVNFPLRRGNRSRSPRRHRTRTDPPAPSAPPAPPPSTPTSLASSS